MARPQRRRRICREPEYRHFQPDGIADREEVNLTCDEFEIIRLVDHLGLTHEQAAKRMDISRTTATECYESARKKLAEAIVTYAKKKNISLQAVSDFGAVAGQGVYGTLDGKKILAGNRKVFYTDTFTGAKDLLQLDRHLLLFPLRQTQPG